MDVIIQDVIDVIENTEYKLTSLYMIRTVQTDYKKYKEVHTESV